MAGYWLGAILLVTFSIDSTQIPKPMLLILGRGFFGLVNTGLGVAIHQGVLWLVRSLLSSRVRTE